MKIHRFIIIILLSAVAMPVGNMSALAQEISSIESIEIGENCNYIRSIDIGKKIYLFKPHEDIESAVDDIIKAMDIQPNFTVREANIDNAVATVADKMLWILYHEDFKNTIDKKTQNKKAFISILAHEIGHHTQNHLQTDRTDPHRDELYADNYSGKVMFRLGHSLEDAQAGVEVFSQERVSKTHPPQSARLIAIRKGWEAEQEKVNKLSTRTPDTTSTPPQDETPTWLLEKDPRLANFANNQQWREVNRLLNEGIHPDSMNEDGRAALHYAAEYGEVRAVELLLSKNADIELADNTSGATALLKAAFKGHAKSVKLLLENGADIEAKSKNGLTALHWAAFEGHAKSVKLLLENGADANVKTKKGNTALHVATSEGHAESVKLLLDNGADIDAKNKDGFTALNWATNGEHAEIVKLIKAAQAGGGGSAAAETRDENGWTELHWAALEGDIEKVKSLISNGADVNAVDVGDDSPFSEKGKKSASYLGHDFTNWLNTGDSVLFVAANQGHAEIVKLLLENGADANAKNDYGWTVLRLAADKEHAEIVKLLLDNGADVNAKDVFGNTALHGAAGKGHAEIVKLLKEYGAVE